MIDSVNSDAEKSAPKPDATKARQVDDVERLLLVLFILKALEAEGGLVGDRGKEEGSE